MRSTGGARLVDCIQSGLVSCLVCLDSDSGKANHCCTYVRLGVRDRFTYEHVIISLHCTVRCNSRAISISKYCAAYTRME